MHSKWNKKVRVDESVYISRANLEAILEPGAVLQIDPSGQLLASGGMTGMEVLRAATLHGAEAIGYGQDLGSLEVGKFADLLILDKNPLLDIRNTNASDTS